MSKAMADAKREARELAAAGEAFLKTHDEFAARRAGRAGMFDEDRAAIQADTARLRAFGGEDSKHLPRTPVEYYSPPVKEAPKEEPRCCCGQLMAVCLGNCQTP